MFQKKTFNETPLHVALIISVSQTKCQLAHLHGHLHFTNEPFSSNVLFRQFLCLNYRKHPKSNVANFVWPSSAFGEFFRLVVLLSLQL